MYRSNGTGIVTAQSSPTFSYPNDIIGRSCSVWASGRWKNLFTVVEDGFARDCVTGISAKSRGWKSENGARKHALEELCKKLHAHFEPIRARDAEQKRLREERARQERERQAREAEIRRLQQQLLEEKESHKRQLNDRKNWLNSQFNRKRNEYNIKHNELINIQDQINNEQKEIEEFKVERSEAGIKLIITLGHTGDGKSTFCNRLCGDKSLFGDKGPFKTSGNGASCTQNHSKSKIVINNKKLIMVDTPGFSDSFGRDREHGNKLCKYLRGCGGINNILLIRNSTNVRFDAEFQKMLEEYYSMFGDDFFRLLIIIATRIDSKINKLQFQENNQKQSMQQDISTKFKLNMNIPVISIGLENYEDSIKNLVDIISDNKVECTHIKSPIDELQAKQRIVKGQDNELKLEVDRIQNEINSVNQAINAL